MAVMKHRKIYDHKWERLALRHLVRQPNCVVCGGKAEHVDHVMPIRVAPWRRLDPTNLQSLCHGCHNRITVAYERGSVAGVCDAQGQPLDPAHPWQQASNARAIAVANIRPRPSPMVAAMLKRMATHREGGEV
jgi:hypothetical protein